MRRQDNNAGSRNGLGLSAGGPNDRFYHLVRLTSAADDSVMRMVQFYVDNLRIQRLY